MPNCKLDFWFENSAFFFVATVLPELVGLDSACQCFLIDPKRLGVKVKHGQVSKQGPLVIPCNAYAPPVGRDLFEPVYQCYWSVKGNYHLSVIQVGSLLLGFAFSS
jgi:hypothetical protein